MKDRRDRYDNVDQKCSTFLLLLLTGRENREMRHAMIMLHVRCRLGSRRSSGGTEGSVFPERSFRIGKSCFLQLVVVIGTRQCFHAGRRRRMGDLLH